MDKYQDIVIGKDVILEGKDLKGKSQPGLIEGRKCRVVGIQFTCAELQIFLRGGTCGYPLSSFKSNIEDVHELANEFWNFFVYDIKTKDVRQPITPDVMREKLEEIAAFVLRNYTKKEK